MAVAVLSARLPAELLPAELTGVPEGVAAGVVDGVRTITLAIKQDPAFVSQFLTHSPVFILRRNSLFTGT